MYDWSDKKDINWIQMDSFDQGIVDRVAYVCHQDQGNGQKESGPSLLWLEITDQLKKGKKSL